MLPPDPLPHYRIGLTAIAQATAVIDPVFLNTPQYECEPLSTALGCALTLKVETTNPIRCFKGRGAGLLVNGLLADARLQGRPIVTASAGNWGQAVAYAGRAAGLPVVVYAATRANPLKLDRMRALGADVRLHGDDFDAAKMAAQAFADSGGGVMVVDSLDAQTAEGAGTIGRELLAHGAAFDSIVVSLGNGALLNGIARWVKAVAPSTRVIGVCAEGADAMARSWRSGVIVVADHMSTIADGIGVRVPVPEAVTDMTGIVDDVLLVSDAQMIAAMRLVFAHAGLVVEPAGAAGVAAILTHGARFAGQRVATVLCGSNLTAAQVQDWIV